MVAGYSPSRHGIDSGRSFEVASQKQREMNASILPAQLPSSASMQFRTQTQRMVSLTFRLGLLTSISIIMTIS